MEIDAIVWALETLGSATMHRTPPDLTVLGEPWFTQFRNMPEAQFKRAIDEIVKTEISWPSVSVIYKYAEDWTDAKKGKDICPYCEGSGFLLIRSKGMGTAYACKCSKGKKVWKNLKIASYESLGIPWPKPIEKPSFSKKMSKENRRLIDTFLGRIGEKILEEELLSEMMVDGSLESA